MITYLLLDEFFPDEISLAESNPRSKEQENL